MNKFSSEVLNLYIFRRTASIEERVQHISLLDATTKDDPSGPISINSSSSSNRIPIITRPLQPALLPPNHTSLREIAARRAAADAAGRPPDCHLSDLAIQTTWKQTVSNVSPPPPPPTTSTSASQSEDSEPIYAQVNLCEKYARRAKRLKQTPQHQQHPSPVPDHQHECDETDGYSMVGPRESVGAAEPNMSRERPKSFNVTSSDYEEVIASLKLFI